MSAGGSGSTSFPTTSGSFALVQSNSSFVLDAWPILEWFRGRQPAAGKIDSLLVRAADREVILSMSRINLGEIFYITAKGFGEDAARFLVEQMLLMNIQMVSVADSHIESAARLKARYRISYADAFAADLANRTNAPLVTGDPDFRALAQDGWISLHWIGA